MGQVVASSRGEEESVSLKEVALAVAQLKAGLKSSVLITSAQAWALLGRREAKNDLLAFQRYSHEGMPLREINTFAFFGALTCVATESSAEASLTRAEVLHSLFDVEGTGLLRENDLVAMLSCLRLGLALVRGTVPPPVLRSHLRRVVLDALESKDAITASDLYDLAERTDLRFLLDMTTCEATPPPFCDLTSENGSTGKIMIPSARPPPALLLAAAPLSAPLEEAIPASPVSFESKNCTGPPDLCVVTVKCAANMICDIMKEDTLSKSDPVGLAVPRPAAVLKNDTGIILEERLSWSDLPGPASPPRREDSSNDDARLPPPMRQGSFEDNNAVLTPPPTREDSYDDARLLPPRRGSSRSIEDERRPSIRRLLCCSSFRGGAR